MSLHETDRPCFNCAARGLITQFHLIHGYTAADLLNHMTDLLADIVASTAKEGQEQQAVQTVNDLLQVQFEGALTREAQRRAERASTPSNLLQRMWGNA